MMIIFNPLERTFALPLPRALNAYQDIERVLSRLQALDTYPATYTLRTRADAVRWRLRANTYRKLLRDNDEAENLLPRGQGTSPFDRLVFRLSGRAVLIDRDSEVGQLTVGGKPVDLADAPADAGDDDFEELFGDKP